jgi:hypothetical protein
VAFLGNAKSTDEELIALQGDLATRLHLAANRLGALTLVLTGPIPPEQLTQLAATLDRRLSAADESRDDDTQLRSYDGAEINLSTARNGHNGNGSAALKTHALTIGSALSTLKVHALSDLTLRGRPEAPALIIVLRRFAPRAALDRVADLGETSGWPILGVVGFRQNRKPHRFRSVPKSSVAVSTKSDGVSTPKTVLAATEAQAVVGAAAAKKVFTSKQPDQQRSAQ